jgi:AbrB family transcriptional regulator, transcriptional pleiotropic regulator of transition state genes
MMKGTGMIRKLDELGRIVIPKELRRTFEIAEKDAMEIFVEDDRIILRKYAPGCTNCGDDNVYKSIGNIKFCRKCYEKLIEGAA